MLIKTEDFPQADKLDHVGKVAEAVAEGKRTDNEIEKFIGLDSEGRQGRYYRRAAEILGLINTAHNNSVLTPLGEEFSSLGTTVARFDFLARCLSETPVFQRALHYIHKYNPSDNQLKLWFRSFYPGAQNTADRRFSTFISYLRDAKLIQYRGETIKINKYAGAVVKEVKSIKNGLTGKPVESSVANKYSDTTAGTIKFEVDVQKRERANQIHWKLVTAKAEFLKNRGLQASENELIDLFTVDGNNKILYEMKSITGNNILSQTRKAIAQLYEYRYVFSIPKAQLCIVTNAAIAKSDDWIVDYLTKDRLIAYEWTNNFETFQCHKGSKDLLGKFAP